MLEVALQDISLFSFGSTTEGLGDLWKFCRSWAGSDSSKQEPFFLEVGGRAVLFWNVQGRHDRRGLSRHVGRFDWRLGGVHLSTTIRPQRRCSTRRDGRSRWNFQSIFTQPYMSGILPPMRPRAPKKNNAFKWYIYITLEAQAVRPYSPRRQGSEDQSPDLVHATTAAHAAALQATSRRNKLELPFITIR